MASSKRGQRADIAGLADWVLTELLDSTDGIDDDNYNGKARQPDMLTRAALNRPTTPRRNSPQYRKNLQSITSVLKNDEETLLELAILREKRDGEKRTPLPTSRLADAYAAEANRLEALNESMGVTLDQHPGLKKSIDTAVFMSIALGTSDTDPNKLLLAAHHLHAQAEESQSSLASAQAELATLMKRVYEADKISRRIVQLSKRDQSERDTALQEFDSLTNQGEGSEVRSSKDPVRSVFLPSVHSMEQQIKFGQKKAEEYTSRFGLEREKLKELVRTFGPSSGNYSHEDIRQLQGQVNTAKQVLAQKQADIDVFQGLPPDLELAEFRLQESQAEYETLQGQFAELRETLANRYYED